MEAAKIVEVEGGVAFQGLHAFYSNLYMCTVKDENGPEFYSVEHLLAQNAQYFTMTKIPSDDWRQLRGVIPTNTCTF